MVSVPVAPSTQVSGSVNKPTAQIAWQPIAWFGALLVLCYAPILYRMGVQWATDENMGHGFFVPLFAGYVAWQRRHELAAAPVRPNGWGLVLVIWGAAQATAGTLGAELFTARVSFVIALIGVVLYLGGTQYLKILLFPLGLLFFMIPIPAIVYAALTLRLQTFASELGELMIGWMGIPVLRAGNTLQLPSQTLDIAEACSGIRSLLSLGFLSLVYAYFMDRRVWMRWALLIATIPIAIGANGVRVAVTGLLSEINTQLAQGAYHEAEGYLVFVVAFIALISAHKILSFGAKKLHFG